MNPRSPNDQDPETTHERPSSFREILYRDRRLESRRQIDRRLRARANERNGTGDGGDGNGEGRPTYFPALSRILSRASSTEVRAIVVVVVLVAVAFLFGRWVGQQDAAEPAPQSAGTVTLV